MWRTKTRNKWRTKTRNNWSLFAKLPHVLSHHAENQRIQLGGSRHHFLVAGPTSRVSSTRLPTKKPGQLKTVWSKLVQNLLAAKSNVIGGPVFEGVSWCVQYLYKLSIQATIHLPNFQSPIHTLLQCYNAQGRYCKDLGATTRLVAALLVFNDAFRWVTATHQLWVKVLQVEDLGCPDPATVTLFTVDSLGFSMDK